MIKAAVALLQKHFDLALDAPDGIKKLRELILTLAMQGKLVPQDPKDQPASALLKEIEAEKRRLVKEGKIKERGKEESREGAKTRREMKPEDVPYAVPAGWEWVRLGNVAEVNGGFAFKSSRYTENGMRVIRISDFDEKGFKNNKIVRYTFSSALENFKLEPNNILMAMTGGTVGKSLLVKTLPELMVVNQRVATIKIRDGISPEFINSLIRTNLIQDAIQAAKNSTNDNISMGDITGFLVPLPPLAEQKRIVAKIDQLMASCDALEELRDKRQRMRLDIHAAAIHQILDPTFAPSRLRVGNILFSHFSELYSVKENVANLRKAILQLAVMGKLVPQDSRDQPASELLKEIEAEKRRLVLARQLKIGQTTEDSKSINQDIELPKSWVWSKGAGIFFITKLAGFEYTKYFKLSDEGEIPVIRAQNVRPFDLDLTSLKYIDRKTSEMLERCALTKKALLVTFIGAGIGDVGIFDRQERWHLAPNVAKMELFSGCDGKIDLRFMNIFLISPLGRREIFKHLKSTAQPSISMGTIRDIDYPIPPLAEQKRIVAKVDQFMALCDSLEQGIEAAKKKQSTILDAVVAQV